VRSTLHKPHACSKHEQAITYSVQLQHYQIEILTAGGQQQRALTARAQADFGVVFSQRACG